MDKTLIGKRFEYPDKEGWLTGTIIGDDGSGSYLAHVDGRGANETLSISPWEIGSRYFITSDTRFLYVVASSREYENDERYYGADSVHLSQKSAVAAILADMDDTLESEFSDEDDEEEPPTVDKVNFTITKGWHRFTWHIDTIEMPPALCPKGKFPAQVDAGLRRLWMRMGVSLYVSNDEERVLLSELADEKANQVLRNIVSEGRFAPDGESYIPESTVDTYNRECGTNYEIRDVEFSL